MAEILESLQNLQGSTLGELFRLLNDLIRARNDEITKNLSYILSNFNPKNHFEQIAKIRLVDQYKCYEEVLSILKSEDTFYFTHCLQCSWFFQNSDFDPEYLVSSVFPMLSYSARCKVLKRYSKYLKNTAVADKLFHLIKHRYGLNTALILLPACSESFIKNLIQESYVRIPVYILLPLIKSNPNLVFVYIESLLDILESKKRVACRISLSTYERVFSLIASKQPEKFSLLVEKHWSSFPYLKIGKRVTRRLLKSSYDSFSKNVTSYKRFVVWKNVTSNLSLEQISTLQLSFFPGDVSSFLNGYHNHTEYMNIIERLKNQKVKQNLICSNFQKAYGKPITDYLTGLSSNLVDFLPNEVGEKWAEIKLETNDDLKMRGHFMAYLPPTKALPEIKELIKGQPDVNLRLDLVKNLFKSVKRTDDPAQMGQLCQYIVKRFRNERPYILEDMAREIQSFNRLTEIPLDNWASIQELCDIISFNQNCCPNVVINLISTYIHCKLIKGLPVQEELTKLMKLANKNYDFTLCKNTPFEKYCLEWFVEWLSGQSSENEKFGDLELNLFSRICSWNSLHPNEKIGIPQWMDNKIEKMFLAHNEYFHKKIRVLESLKKDNVKRFALMNMVFPKFLHSSVLCYKLRSDPVSIRENHAHILKELLGQDIRSYKHFFIQARLYTLFKIPEVFSDYCLKVLRGSDSDDEITTENKKNAIIILSIMLPLNLFIEVISDYYPESLRIEEFSDEEREKYEIQMAIASSFRLVSVPTQIIECIKKFAKGDYFKLVVSSLTSVCIKIPEYKALPLLKDWLDSPVSIRKHIINAYLRVAPVQDTQQMMVGLFEKDTNISLRALIIENALRFFSNEPTKETFFVLRAVIEKLQSTDDSALEKLVDLRCIPDEYVSDYIGILWDRIGLWQENISCKTRNNLINLIDSKILSLLDEQFCDVLILHVLSKDQLFDMRSFIVKYLIHSKDNNNLLWRFQKLTPTLESLLLRLNEYDLKKEHVFYARYTIFHLIDAIAMECLNTKDSSILPQEVLVLFKTFLSSKCKEDDIVLELMNLEIAIAYLTSETPTLLHFANSLAVLLDICSSAYGTGIIEEVYSSVYKILTWKDISFVELAEMLLLKNTHPCNLLALKMLPTYITSDVEKYERVIQLILKSSDPIFKPYANKIFKELSSSVGMF